METGPAVDPYMEVTSRDDQSPIGLPLMALKSRVQQQVLAIYHLFLCLDYPPRKPSEQRRTIEGALLQPLLEQMIQGLMEDFHLHQAERGMRYSVSGPLRIPRPSECHTIERLLESQECNTLPAGLPEPKPLQTLNCKGQKKRPAAAGSMLLVCTGFVV